MRRILRHSWNQANLCPGEFEQSGMKGEGGVRRQKMCMCMATGRRPWGPWGPCVTLASSSASSPPTCIRLSWKVLLQSDDAAGKRRRVELRQHEKRMTLFKGDGGGGGGGDMSDCHYPSPSAATSNKQPKYNRIYFPTGVHRVLCSMFLYMGILRE